MIPQPPPMFRPEALQSLSSPDKLDTLLQVTRPVGWVVAASCAVLTAVALLWGWFGRLPTQIQMPCLLVSRLPAEPMVAPHSGVVTAMQASTGDPAKVGAAFLRLKLPKTDSEPESKILPLTAPKDGKWLHVAVSPGQAVTQGTVLGWFEPKDDAPADALLLARLTDGQRVEQGMDARVALSNVGTGGQLDAKVHSVTAYPVPQEQAASLAGHAGLARTLNQDPAVWPIRLRVHAGATDATGTLCTATIKLRSERPLARLLPFLSNSGG